MAPASSHSDESNFPLRIEHHYDDETPPSIAIIQAIAILEDTNPMELPEKCEMQLYDHVDPVALDRFVTDAATEDTTSVTVELTLHNDHQYAVQIRDTGHLVVHRPS